MVTLSLEEQQLKDIVKQALLELFEERQDLVEALFLEALEDWGLLQRHNFIRAIKEGEATETVERQEVFDVLEGVA